VTRLQILLKVSHLNLCPFWTLRQLVVASSHVVIYGNLLSMFSFMLFRIYVSNNAGIDEIGLLPLLTVLTQGLPFEK